MEKLHKIIELPGKNKTAFFRSKLAPKLIQKGVNTIDNPNWIGQHLYILSDDEIKEGDWMFCIDKSSHWFNNLIKYTGGIAHKDSWKKVIATTNPDLIKEGIASIDDEFIKEYVNNPIEEILVEYEGKVRSTTWEYEEPEYYDIRLSSNGSIIIKPSQETWDDVLNNFYQATIGKQMNELPEMDFKDWLEQEYEVPKLKQK